MNRLKILGWIVLVTQGYTALVIMVMHVLQPDPDPFVHAISEYVNGSYGSLMTSIFFSQGLGSIAMAAIIMRTGLKQRRARIASVLFIVAAIGGTIAGIFPSDPVITASPTSSGIIHAIAGLIRFLSLALTLPIISAIFKDTTHWKSAAKTLNILAYLFVIIFIVSIIILANLNLFGLGQRLFITILLVWMSIAAYPMIQMNGDPKN